MRYSVVMAWGVLLGLTSQAPAQIRISGGG